MIETVIDFIQANGVEMWALWGAIITGASIIVKLTPTKRDDKVFTVALKILNALALNPNEEKRKEAQRKKEKLEAELNERNDDRSVDSLTNTLR